MKYEANLALPNSGGVITTTVDGPAGGDLGAVRKILHSMYGADANIYWIHAKPAPYVDPDNWLRKTTPVVNNPAPVQKSHDVWPFVWRSGLMKLSEIIAELRVTAAAIAKRLPVPPDYSADHVRGFVKKALAVKSDETFILEVSSRLWRLDLGTLIRLAEESPDVAAFFQLCYGEALKTGRIRSDVGAGGRRRLSLLRPRAPLPGKSTSRSRREPFHNS